MKVYDGFQQKGIGYVFFTEVYEYFSALEPIKAIHGFWSKDDEFSYVEGGQSTDLTVFNALVSAGFNREEAALNTQPESGLEN